MKGYFQQYLYQNIPEIQSLSIMINPQNDCLYFPDNLIEAEMFPCGSGFTAVSIETRCLYKLDKFNIIDGCRDYKHLQDCGMVNICK